MKENSTTFERIISGSAIESQNARQLYCSDVIQKLEISTAATLPPHALMQRAGLAIAQFAVAVAPHAQAIWIPCGPGNNGGDGYETARHLKSWGKDPVVTPLFSAQSALRDADDARKNTLNAGVLVADAPPENYDLCIDALFGIGQIRPFNDRCITWINQINACPSVVIAVDVPSGLDANTGSSSERYVKADFTLSLLALKPGLFTGNGREASGEIWFNSLGAAAAQDCLAQLNTHPAPFNRAHNTHKGSYGDVGIVGGFPGMTGAALLAAEAALRAGAGRVFVGLLDSNQHGLNVCRPELMFRAPSELHYESMTVVAGCGGGLGIHAHLAGILKRSAKVVLDADALNAIARDAALQNQLKLRSENTTVLTPHPLEAARLLGVECAEVQADRIQAAQSLATRFSCTVVLKGSGTIISAPGMLPRINPTGNARLATAGTGDVLAGLIGSRMASGSQPFQAACHSVFIHGQVADAWPPLSGLTALQLAQSL